MERCNLINFPHRGRSHAFQRWELRVAKLSVGSRRLEGGEREESSPAARSRGNRLDHGASAHLKAAKRFVTLSFWIGAMSRKIKKKPMTSNPREPTL